MDTEKQDFMKGFILIVSIIALILLGATKLYLKNKVNIGDIINVNIKISEKQVEII